MIDKNLPAGLNGVVTMSELSAEDRHQIADVEYGKISNTIDTAIVKAQSLIDVVDESSAHFGTQVAAILQSINSLVKSKITIVNEFVNNTPIVETTTTEIEEAQSHVLSASAFDELVGKKG